MGRELAVNSQGLDDPSLPVDAVGVEESFVSVFDSDFSVVPDFDVLLRLP